MELSNNEVYTTSTNNFGQGFSLGSRLGFAFPAIQLGGSVELTPEEIALAASATPESGVDFALTSGEFGSQGDLAAEGLGHGVGISYLGLTPVEDSEASDDSPEMGSDGDDLGNPGETEIADYHEADSGFVAMAGFDPGRASELADELGEDLVVLAQEIARDLGADCSPEDFLAELHKRRFELAEEDYHVELRAKRLGAMDRPEREAASVLRLADHGRAQLQMVEGELLLVPAGAAPQDVIEAARRSRNDRLAKSARLNRESEREASLARSKERAMRTMFEQEIHSNMKAASGRAKAGTPVPNARAEAVRNLRDFRGYWNDLPEERKVLIADPGTDAGIKRAFARAASSQAGEARFKRARDLGKAFPAPVVPFGGTPVDPADQSEVLYIERLKSTRQALKTSQPDSPAAKTVSSSIIRRAKVSAFYCLGEGVAHARPEQEWSAPVITTVFGEEPEPRRFQPLKALVANAIDTLYGCTSPERKVGPQGFDPSAKANAWADQVPDPDRESGPDQRGAAAPREYNLAHRRDAQVVTATGRDLNPSWNDRQQAAANRRISKALANVPGKVASPEASAWNTALSIYLGEIEDPAERLELMLQTKGRQKWAKLEAGSKDPAELKAAARVLADAGKLRALRGRESGTLYVVTTEALEGTKRAGLQRDLLRLMVMGRVAVPRGTRLARRVAAHKGVITRESRVEQTA